MKTLFKADLAFTPSWMRIEKPVLLVVFVLVTIGFMSSPKASFVMSILYGVLLMLSEAICEYAKYCGIGCSKQNGFNLIRSSSLGPQTVKSALLGDMLLTFFRAVIIVGIPSYIGERNSTSAMSEFIEEPYLLIALSNAALAFALIMINKLVARSISVTLQTYMVIEALLLWLLNAIYCAGVFVIIAPDFKDNFDTVAISLILFAVSVVLGVLFSWLNIRKCIKGFSAGYRDLEVIND